MMVWVNTIMFKKTLIYLVICYFFLAFSTSNVLASSRYYWLVKVTGNLKIILYGIASVHYQSEDKAHIALYSIDDDFYQYCNRQLPSSGKADGLSELNRVIKSKNPFRQGWYLDGRNHRFYSICALEHSCDLLFRIPFPLFGFLSYRGITLPKERWNIAPALSSGICISQASESCISNTSPLGSIVSLSAINAEADNSCSENQSNTIAELIDGIVDFSFSSSLQLFIPSIQSHGIYRPENDCLWLLVPHGLMLAVLFQLGLQ